MINELSIDFENHMIDIVVPSQIINQSNQLSTVSIPSGLVCKHTFQAFIDKNFKVRGYQKVDFELSSMEFYEDLRESQRNNVYENEIGKFKRFLFSDEIINSLRNCIDGKEILGMAFFTLEGKVLYSSLNINTLYNTIREFEVRNEKNLIQVKRYFLILANNQKIFSQYIEFGEFPLIATLIFSDMVRLGMGDLLLRKLLQDLLKKYEN